MRLGLSTSVAQHLRAYYTANFLGLRSRSTREASSASEAGSDDYCCLSSLLASEMVPWFIAWPLRKAAILPIAGISFAALGAAYGSFKITKNAVLVMAPLPKGKKPSTGSTWTASAAALTFAGAIVGIRELAFAPKMPPSPDLPIEGVPLQVQLRNATVKAMVSGVPRTWSSN